MHTTDEKFFNEVQIMFEQYLSHKKDNLQLRIRNIEKNSILSDTEMNYTKVFFDSDLNFYKVDKEGKIVKVENDNFEAVVMRQE